VWGPVNNKLVAEKHCAYNLKVFTNHWVVGVHDVEQRPDLRSWKVKGRRDSKFALLWNLLSEEETHKLNLLPSSSASTQEGSRGGRGLKIDLCLWGSESPPSLISSEDSWLRYFEALLLVGFGVSALLDIERGSLITGRRYMWFTYLYDIYKCDIYDIYVLYWFRGFWFGTRREDLNIAWEEEEDYQLLKTKPFSSLVSPNNNNYQLQFVSNTSVVVNTPMTFQRANLDDKYKSFSMNQQYALKSVL